MIAQHNLDFTDGTPIAFAIPRGVLNISRHPIPASGTSNAGLPKPDTGNPAPSLVGAEPAPPPPATGLRPHVAGGGGLLAVAQCRQRQIDRGHTVQADREKGLFHLMSLLRLWLNDAQNAWPAQRRLRDPGMLRHALIHLAATCVAIVDVLDGREGE